MAPLPLVVAEEDGECGESDKLSVVVGDHVTVCGKTYGTLEKTYAARSSSLLYTSVEPTSARASANETVVEVTLRTVPVKWHHDHTTGAKAWIPHCRTMSPTARPCDVAVVKVKTFEVREYETIFAPVPETTEQPEAFPIVFPEDTSTAVVLEIEQVVMLLF